MPKKIFDQDLYKKLSINELILLGIWLLADKKEKPTFERLVKECFNLFPKAFSFPEISNWPDSRKLDRPLRTLRKKKLVSGSPRTSFSLTKTGEKIVGEILKRFRQRKLKI